MTKEDSEKAKLQNAISEIRFLIDLLEKAPRPSDIIHKVRFDARLLLLYHTQGRVTATRAQNFIKYAYSRLHHSPDAIQVGLIPFNVWKSLSKAKHPALSLL